MAKVLVAALATMTMMAGIVSVSAAVDTDDVLVSATVDTTITMDCGADVDLGTLTTASTFTGTTTCNVDTNENDGYQIGVESDNGNGTAGLYSADSGEELEALASSAVSAGVDGFGVYVSTPAAGGSINAGFDNDTTADVAVTTSSQVAVSYADEAPAGEDTIFTYVAAVHEATPSGVYSTTMTYTATTL